MILHWSFEEITAAFAGAERVLEGAGSGGVAAPPRVIADIEALRPRLTGDFSVETLADARSILRAVEYILEEARVRMDHFIIEQHPAAESAVASYFDYAHLLTVQDRVRRMESQMAALIELMSGAPATDETALSYQFPD
jgi:hypothetical protein